jgi:hypothetical protein
MKEVIDLLLPFISTTKNYDEILRKLASFAFYETYIITLVLRANPRFDAFFTAVESWGPVGKVVAVIPHHEVFNLSGIVIAFLVAILTHMFKFHDKISDVFGIRSRFDRKSILIPLAHRVGSIVTKDKEEKIVQRRDELMRTLFYKYASSRAEHPLVDKHDIEHALTAWSWFWVCVEGLVYFGLGAFIGWWLDSRDLAVAFAIVWVALLVLAFVQRISLDGYARAQIDTIAADPTASYDVKQKFDAL